MKTKGDHWIKVNIHPLGLYTSLTTFRMVKLEGHLTVHMWSNRLHFHDSTLGFNLDGEYQRKDVDFE
jgi:hypothetical protein